MTKKGSNNESKKRSKKMNALSKIFEDLNKLIEAKKNEHLCNQHVKLDCTKSSQYTLAVIIWKDKTQHDLSNNLIAARLSPILSTIINVVKNKSFCTRPSIKYKFIARHISESKVILQ